MNKKLNKTKLVVSILSCFLFATVLTLALSLGQTSYAIVETVPYESTLITPTASSSLAGDGVDNPYEIRNIEDLEFFRTQINSGKNLGKAYTLLADINASGYKLSTPIGPQMNGFHFQGKFYGNNNKITLGAIESSTGYLGLFGNISSNAEISNLCLDTTIELNNSNIQYVGAIAGRADNSTILNCTSKTTFTINSPSNTLYCGSIVGYASSSTLEKCRNDGDIIITSPSSEIKVGGIVGANYDSAISQCYNNKSKINIQGSNGNVYLGGISGSSTAIIKQCNNFKSIIDVSTTKNAFIGGIVGRTTKNVIECANSSQINSNGLSSTTSTIQMGGIVGLISANNVSINNCYNSGNLTGDVSNLNNIGLYKSALTLNNSLGGILGRVDANNISISNSYNIGEIESNFFSIIKGDEMSYNNRYASWKIYFMDYREQNGGIVGSKDKSITTSNCFSTKSFDKLSVYANCEEYTACDDELMAKWIIQSTGRISSIYDIELDQNNEYCFRLGNQTFETLPSNVPKDLWIKTISQLEKDKYATISNFYFNTFGDPSSVFMDKGINYLYTYNVWVKEYLREQTSGGVGGDAGFMSGLIPTTKEGIEGSTGLIKTLEEIKTFSSSNLGDSSGSIWSTGNNNRNGGYPELKCFYW